MARVVEFTGNHSLFSPQVGEDMADFLKRTSLAMQALEQQSHRAMKSGESVGLLYNAPVADGYACYRVIEVDPLVLEHVPYLDGYRLPAPHLRGLTFDDIRTCARKESALSAMRQADMGLPQEYPHEA